MPTCPHCSMDCKGDAQACPRCGLPVAEPPISRRDPWVGMKLPGGYVLEECIGDGGMGRVYRAEQTALGRFVAVKIVHPHLLSDDSTAVRFINEARVASRLNHPHSVSVIDFGRTEQGLLYLVMEHLRGRDLARVLTEDGLLSLERTINVLRQLLEVLSEAHQLGIVHLDLKPDNIIVEPMRRGGDFIKVVDFGLAQMMASIERPSQGNQRTISGTPDYMSPEQCRGEPPDARSDLYAVGIILFLMLTGRLPFEAATPTQVLLNHLAEPPPDPRQVSPSRGVPDALAAVLFRALQKPPADRFQTATEFAAALDEVKFQITSPMRLASVLPPSPTANCHVCGEPVPLNQKFCGACGEKTPWAVSLPPRSALSIRPAAEGVSIRPPASTLVFPFPFVGRDDDIIWLLGQLQETAAGVRVACVHGDAGIGKSSLLREFVRVSSAEGHRVVWLEPDPWWLGVAWHSLRRAVRRLVDIDNDEDVPVAGPDAPPDVHVGLRLLYAGEGQGQTANRRRACVAAAFGWALESAFRASEYMPLIVILDDLERLDGASRNAVADVVAAGGTAASVLVLACQTRAPAASWLKGVPAREIEPLGSAEVQSLVAGTAVAEMLDEIGVADISPFYLDQLARFSREGGTQPPARIGDLIATRIARLRPDGRRVLQAVAVLGDRADIDQLNVMVGSGVDVAAASPALVIAGLLEQHDRAFCFTHPLLRELTEATIPAEVDRALHASALEVLSATPLPLEVRAHLMTKGGDVFGALVLTESVGDAALGRGDSEGAIEAFREGHELARRSSGHESLDDPMRVIATFARKFAEALTEAGYLAEAEGMLREATDFMTSPQQRARLLFALARVAHRRGREAEAFEQMRSAMELAERDGADDLVTAFEEEATDWLAHS